jgi:hypothetical protein
LLCALHNSEMQKFSRRNLSFFTTLKALVPQTFQEKNPIIVLDAATLDQFWRDEWTCGSDQTFGGPSIAEITQVKHDANNDSYLRFHGSQNMTTERAKKLKVVGGYCAFRGEIDCPNILGDYKGFEIVYRSAFKTACAINLTVEDKPQEDIFQVKIAHLTTHLSQFF